MKGRQDKRMDGLMEETVKEAIFITVPLNQDAARRPAEHGGVSQAATHAGGTSIYVSIPV